MDTGPERIYLINILHKILNKSIEKIFDKFTIENP